MIGDRERDRIIDAATRVSDLRKQLAEAEAALNALLGNGTAAKSVRGSRGPSNIDLVEALLASNPTVEYSASDIVEVLGMNANVNLDVDSVRAMLARLSNKKGTVVRGARGRYRACPGRTRTGRVVLHANEPEEDPMAEDALRDSLREAERGVTVTLSRPLSRELDDVGSAGQRPAPTERRAR